VKGWSQLLARYEVRCTHSEPAIRPSGADYGDDDYDDKNDDVDDVY
jgi:hypothetical protein